MKRLFALCYCIVAFKCVNAQSPWVATGSLLTGRYDDISFINKDTGWAVGSPGIIIHTKDGGNTWITQQSIPGSYMRSIEFASNKKGFAGGLEYNGNNVFYKTTDGGNTWIDISNVITGTSRGICGICSVDTNVTYAVGVWASPAYLLKTSDGGNTWTQINMSNYARRLVDVQFTDANHGYVTGQSNITSEGAVILKTADGGISWAKVFTNNKAGDIVWKIQSLDVSHWFASIQKVAAGWNVCLKSRDGGNTWNSSNVVYDSTGNFYFQVVGFMDTLKGWTGGHWLYQTINGGNSWSKIDSASCNWCDFDRFVKVNSNTAYITQSKVYKLQSNWVGIKEEEYYPDESPELNVYPNPTKNNFTVVLTLKRKTMFNIRVIDPIANTVVWENIGQKAGGKYEYKINQKMAVGEYIVYVMTNEGCVRKKIIILD
jgi:photosystem II stability/assembly factor-like uncharacterized protein